MSEIKEADCEACGQRKTCQLTGLGHAVEKWLCGTCIVRALGHMADEDEAKYAKERANDAALMAAANAPVEKFSVCQFFEDGQYEYVRRFIPLNEALEVARHYTTSVGAQIGVVQRVIITDAGDCTVFEWQYGKGIVFPPQE